MSYLERNFDLESSELVNLIDELPFWSAPFGLKLLDQIKLKKGIHVLDIGFGLGFPLTEIAMRLGTSSKVYGIDPWKAAFKRTQAKISTYGIQNIELIEGVAENIPLSDNSIDLIVSNNGINNVSDLQQTLSECARVIKSKGQFVQTVNLDSTMLEFYELLEEALVNLGQDSLIEEMKAHIYKKRKPLDQFTSTIENSGFTISQITEDKFSYKFVDGTALFNHFFIQLAFLDGWKDFVPQDLQKQVFQEIENKMNEKAEKDGFFELSVPFVVIDAIRN